MTDLERRNLLLSFADGHLACGAVKSEREASSVVGEIEPSGFFCPLIFRAHAEFVADAVPAPHEFISCGGGRSGGEACPFAVCQRSRFDRDAIEVRGGEASDGVDDRGAEERDGAASDVDFPDTERICAASF